ncbi:MAG: hypothetical protein JZD41_02050 [Thermoproteus sp.]|nr:hypothetical protein [Thermoproteus sp.]
MAAVERQLILQSDIAERAQLVEEVMKELSGIRSIERPEILQYAAVEYPRETIEAAYALGGIGAALIMATMYLGHADVWEVWKRKRKGRIETVVDDPIGRALIAYINGDIGKEELKSIIPSSLLSKAMTVPMNLDEDDLPLKILRAILAEGGVTDEYRALYEAVLMGAATKPELLSDVLEGRGMVKALAALGHYDTPFEVPEILRVVHLYLAKTNRIEEKRKALIKGGILLGDKPLAEIVVTISPLYTLLRKKEAGPDEVEAAVERTLEIYNIGGFLDEYLSCVGGEEGLRELGERLKRAWIRELVSQVLAEMPEPRILSLYYRAIFAAAADDVGEFIKSTSEIADYGAFFKLPIYIRAYNLAVKHGKKDVAHLIEGLV